MGAWIETTKEEAEFELERRRTLTWVRGLKHWEQYHLHYNCPSRTLTWVRGLKPFLMRGVKLIFMSHPYMGAWIETMKNIIRQEST